MKNYFKIFLAIPAVLAACAPHPVLRPAGEGEFHPMVAVGGPFVAAFGAYVPIPNASVGGRFGLSSDLDLEGNLYLLPLAYSLVSIDAGVAWYPIDGESETMTIEPRLLLYASFKSGVEERVRIYPALSLLYSTPLVAERAYGGVDILSLPYSYGYDPEPVRIVVSPFVGCRWELATGTRLLTEVKWLGANVRTDATVEYINPGGHGGIAPSIGLELSW